MAKKFGLGFITDFFTQPGAGGQQIIQEGVARRAALAAAAPAQNVESLNLLQSAAALALLGDESSDRPTTGTGKLPVSSRREAIQARQRGATDTTNAALRRQELLDRARLGIGLADLRRGFRGGRASQALV